MPKFHIAFFLFLLSYTLCAQKSNSKVQIFEENGRFGVKSGKKTIITPVYNEIHQEENGLFLVKDTTGVWGYHTSKGNVLISPRFVETKPFKSNTALVKKENGWGIITKEGHFLLKPIYKSITESEAGSYQAKPFQEIIVFNSNKDSIASFLTDSIVTRSKDIYAYYLDHKLGLLDKSGNKITLPLYDSIGLFHNTIAVASKEGKWGILDNYGKEVIPFYYIQTSIDNGQFIRAKRMEEGIEKWYLFNSHGDLILKEPIDYIGEINSNSLFVYKDKGGFGLMNSSSDIILEPLYQSIVKSAEFYVVSSTDGMGVLSAKGKWIYQPNADSIQLLPGKKVIYTYQKKYHLLDSTGWEKICSPSPLNYLADNLFEIKVKNKLGRFNYKGEEILKPVYDSIWPLTPDGGIIVFINKQIGIYNMERDSLVGPNDRIQEIYKPSEGFWGVKIKGKYGFVDNLGRIRIANRYEGIGKFVEGYTPVKLLGKWGFVDKAEVLRVQPIFDEVKDFRNGLAVVKKDGKYGLVNKKGQIVTNFIYDGFEPTIDNYFISLKSNSKGQIQKGLINQEGKEMIFAKYDELELLPDHNLITRKNNLYGVVNQNDLIIFSSVYNHIEFDDHKNNYILTREKPLENVKLEISSK